MYIGKVYSAGSWQDFLQPDASGTEVKQEEIAVALWKFLREEEVFELMGVVFLGVIACTAAAALTAPMEMPEPSKTFFFAQRNVMRVWTFILVPPAVISIVVGIIATVVAAVRAWRSA